VQFFRGAPTPALNQYKNHDRTTHQQ